MTQSNIEQSNITHNDKQVVDHRHDATLKLSKYNCLIGFNLSLLGDFTVEAIKSKQRF